MVWPSHSPDHNSLDNLLFLIKEEIYKPHPELRTTGETNAALEALISAAQASWQHISQYVLNKLCDSMPHRVLDVVDADG
jgi:hypothetical protein